MSLPCEICYTSKHMTSISHFVTIILVLGVTHYTVRSYCNLITCTINITEQPESIMSSVTHFFHFIIIFIQLAVTSRKQVTLTVVKWVVNHFF